jgi:hypothetical protein
MFAVSILVLALGCALAQDSSSQNWSAEGSDSSAEAQQPAAPTIQGTTSQILGCTVTQYAQVLYTSDALLGQNQYLQSQNLQDCITQCLQYSKPCASINFLTDQNLCGLSGSAFNPATSAPSTYEYQVPTSIHASVTCVAAVASAPVGCGKQAAQYQPSINKFQRIIGGTNAKPYSWPWLVNLNTDLGNGYQALCGSSLIRVRDNVEQSDILITAAHCVTDEATQGTVPKAFNASQITAIAAKYNVSGYDAGQQKRTGAKVIFNSGFKFTPQTGAINDIAMIKLDRPIAFNDQIRPVCLPASGEAIPIGKNCVIAGWGRVNSLTQDTATILQQLSVPVQTPQQCSQGWGSTYNQNMMVCAGSLKGDSGTCQGDSGGTLACQQTDGSWTVYGAVSFGVAGTCLSAGMPSIFTRVSSYVDWIHQNAQAMTSL